MKNNFHAPRSIELCAAALLAALIPRLSAAAVVTVVNADTAGKGLNDATPVTPVGGNAGVTIGQQRLIAFNYAATIWGASLDGAVPILIRASFSDSMFCDSSGATLGAAGPTQIFASSDFPPPALRNVWYVGGLASQIAGRDVLSGSPAVTAQFNARIGTPGCFSTSSWYYGLDGNTGPSQFDLVDVVLHEFAHGLGFFSLTNSNAAKFVVPDGETQGLPDIWDYKLFDLVTGLHWSEMTDQQRQASTTRPRQLVWDGANASSAVPNFLTAGTPTLTVVSPPSVAGDYLVGDALFGPPLSFAGVTGPLVDGIDTSGSRLGCHPLPQVPGKVVLLDRGDCTFVIKVKNAQDAGALAVVIANNVDGSPPPPMGGTDSSISIPSVHITLADGSRLRGALAQGVTVNLHLGPARRGADGQNRPMLYTPTTYAAGSSVAHTDPSALLLMDPAYNTALGHKLDLTPYFFKDIGWTVANPSPADLSADIAIAVNAPKNYQKGGTVTYNLTVSNNGPSNAPNVLVFAVLPTGVSFASGSGGCTSGFPCSLGTLSANASRSFSTTLHVDPSFAGSDLKVTFDAAPPFPDPVIANNASTASSGTGGGCASTGSGEPALLLALLALFAVPRSRRRA